MPSVGRRGWSEFLEVSAPFSLAATDTNGGASQRGSGPKAALRRLTK
jgi:hypothetical protein